METTMAKKRTTLWIKAEVVRELKMIGVMQGRPIGDVIANLVEVSKRADHAENAGFRDRGVEVRPASAA
jgi:hypothetical protein